MNREYNELTIYHKYAVEEMKKIGFQFDGDGYPIENVEENFDVNTEMALCVLEILDVFAKQGHSGMSASYCLGILEKVMKFEPITPLTGDDSEWTLVSEDNNRPIYQNRRCSHVFKDHEDRSYDIQGKVLFDWYTGEDGERHKSYYTSSESIVYIEFPYTPTTIYEERESVD